VEPNDELTQEIKDRIDAMSREEMARCHRFDPCGSPLHRGRAGQYFQLAFNRMGGMSPAISKKIGWEKP